MRFIAILYLNSQKHCRHAFCRDCVKKTPSVCPKCKDSGQTFEEAAMGHVYICTHGGGRWVSWTWTLHLFRVLFYFLWYVCSLFVWLCLVSYIPWLLPVISMLYTEKLEGFWCNVMQVTQGTTKALWRVSSTWHVNTCDVYANPNPNPGNKGMTIHHSPSRFLVQL